MTPAQIARLYGAEVAAGFARLAAEVGELTVYDEFSGCGGLSQGATAVPGVVLRHAANHKAICIRSHAANYPGADHYLGDVRSIDVAKFPRYDLFLAAPQCPPFSSARGVRRDFDRDTQAVLWEDERDAKTSEAKRGRLLMHEVPRYLEAMALRGEPVLAGVVENVPQARLWDAWDAWIGRIKNLGYDVRVIAMNAMHARPVLTRWAPQSRNRLFVAYWLRAFGRSPDWDKWLRPQAWCPACEETVTAIQVFKDPRNDMGTYGAHGQYWYRCPHRSCRNTIVEPATLPAAAIIDWTDPGTPIGARKRPIKPSTRARVEAGIRKYAVPVMAEVGGHLFERHPGARTKPVTGPMTAQTTTPSKALAVPPLVVPAGGTWRGEATSAGETLPARTTRETDAIAVPPFITVLRHNETATPVTGPLTTLSTSGSHHALTVPPFLVPLRSGRNRSIDPAAEPIATVVADGSGHGLVVPDAALIMRNNTERSAGGEMSTPIGEPVRTLTTKGHQSLVAWAWEQLLVPYYGTGRAHPASEPVGTVTTKDRWALACIEDLPIDIDQVLLRMLKPAEIGLGMAFADDYIVHGTREQKVMQYGNAVCPPAGEVIVSALVELITGVDLPREWALAP